MRIVLSDKAINQIKAYRQALISESATAGPRLQHLLQDKDLAAIDNHELARLLLRTKKPVYISGRGESAAYWTTQEINLLGLIHEFYSEAVAYSNGNEAQYEPPQTTPLFFLSMGPGNNEEEIIRDKLMVCLAAINQAAEQGGYQAIVRIPVLSADNAVNSNELSTLMQNLLSTLLSSAANFPHLAKVVFLASHDEAVAEPTVLGDTDNRLIMRRARTGDVDFPALPSPSDCLADLPGANVNHDVRVCSVIPASRVAWSGNAAWVNGVTSEEARIVPHTNVRETIVSQQQRFTANRPPLDDITAWKIGNSKVSEYFYPASHVYTAPIVLINCADIIAAMANNARETDAVKSDSVTSDPVQVHSALTVLQYLQFLTYYVDNNKLTDPDCDVFLRKLVDFVGRSAQALLDALQSLAVDEQPVEGDTQAGGGGGKAEPTSDDIHEDTAAMRLRTNLLVYLGREYLQAILSRRGGVSFAAYFIEFGEAYKTIRALNPDTTFNRAGCAAPARAAQIGRMESWLAGETVRFKGKLTAQIMRAVGNRGASAASMSMLSRAGKVVLGSDDVDWENLGQNDVDYGRLGQ